MSWVSVLHDCLPALMSEASVRAPVPSAVWRCDVCSAEWFVSKVSRDQQRPGQIALSVHRLSAVAS